LLQNFQISNSITFSSLPKRYYRDGWQVLYKVKYSSSLDFIKVLLESPKRWADDKKYVHREVIIDFPYDYGRLKDFHFFFQDNKK
jgi:hypothetical protein